MALEILKESFLLVVFTIADIPSLHLQCIYNLSKTEPAEESGIEKVLWTVENLYIYEPDSLVLNLVIPFNQPGIKNENDRTDCTGHAKIIDEERKKNFRELDW